MIGLDTNVVLRYLLQDDPAQTLQANHIFSLSRSSYSPINLNVIVGALVDRLRTRPDLLPLKAGVDEICY